MRLLKLHILGPYSKYAQMKRSRAVSEFAVFWMILGAAISLVLLLGISLLNSILQITVLKKHQSDLTKRNIRLSEIQHSQGIDIRELRSGLRAEKAHVEQLQRKAHLIEQLLEDLQNQHRGE